MVFSSVPSLIVVNLYLLKQHNTYKVGSCSDYEKTFPEGDVLSIEKMKRRAFHLRLLIDRSKNKKVRKEAIKEYVSLIKRISGNN